MAKLSSAERSALPDSAFAYVEPGHKVGSKTEDKYRHFPVHNPGHVRNALSRIAQGARFGDQARKGVLAAAKKFKIDHDEESETGRSLESLWPEVRFITDTPEVRTADQDDTVHIVGYGSVFNSVSRRLGGFHEKVMPTAFNRAMEEGWPDVVCRYNHKEDYVLGTTAADTCRLNIDERGLHYDVIPPNSRADVVELVQRGDVRFSSFAFRCVEEDGDSWEKSEYGLPMRSLHSVELVDVAPVMDPAYGDTTAKARNMRGAVESLARWVDGDPNEIRSVMEAGQAMRFFKRTDRPSPPRLDVESAERRALDDPALSIRTWAYAPAEDDDSLPGDEFAEVPEVEENARPTEEETRAALKAMKNLAHHQLCKQWTDGQPCVRPQGHTADGPQAAEGGHAPLCWAHKSGMPCHMPQGHDGDHEPLNVKTRDAEDEPSETRDAPETELGLDEARAMLEKFEEIDLG